MADFSDELIRLQTALAGEYSIERELGRGGMGIVYLARDVQLDRDVAIKTLPLAFAGRSDVRERFLREARVAAGLSHPHIVPIHRVGEAGGFVYFVMTYVAGETLGERLRTRGPLPAADATRVMREVAWALAYAHGRGIVHRDVKPDNILLEAGTGRALVTDFGIAHGGGSAATDARARTDPGAIMGTAHFMSPEQAAAEPVDGRSDLYGLGVVGYLAVTGRLPFEAPSLPALIVRQATESPRTVRSLAPALPASLAVAIDRCLSRAPEDRYPDGESLAAALVPPSEPRPALPSTLRAWLGARNPLLVPYLAWSAGFGALTLGNLVTWVTGNRPDGPADIVLLGAIAALPLLPIVGFHLNQARRQFRAGHTLADLRGALDIARRERLESESLAREDEESRSRRVLRAATVLSAVWLGATLVLAANGVLHERRIGPLFAIAPMLSTMLLGAVSNALDVQFIPTRLRESWQTGVRDRLWKSRIGEWFARRLGAPLDTRAVGGGIFRPTEAALGVAASELFAALPKAFRDELSELPSTVAALEARAAAARASLDEITALAGAGSPGADLLDQRRAAAANHLAESVAALEAIRLDLLRLHANADDLAPLNTLLDAAGRLGDDIGRLADANREVDATLSR